MTVPTSTFVLLERAARQRVCTEINADERDPDEDKLLLADIVSVSTVCAGPPLIETTCRADLSKALALVFVRFGLGFLRG